MVNKKSSDTDTGVSTEKIIKLFEEKGVSVHKDVDGIRGRIVAALRELNQKEVNEDLNNIIHLFEKDNSKEMEEALDAVNKRYIEVKKGKSKPISVAEFEGIMKDHAPSLFGEKKFTSSPSQMPFLKPKI